MEHRGASDWEKSVIATALADPSAMTEAGELLPSDFSGPQQIVWAEIMNMWNTRGALDIRTLANHLRGSEDWVRVSGGLNFEDYFAEVTQYRGTAMANYVEMVLDASIRRALRRNAALIAAEAEDDTVRARELLDHAEHKLQALRRDRNTGPKSMADLLGVFIPRLQGFREGTIKPAWEPNLLALKNVIQYAEDSEFIVIAARPGEGKSSYMRYESWCRAKTGKAVGILNYENDENEYCRYFLSMETGIDSDKIKDPRLLSEGELEEVLDASERLAHLPLYIQTTDRNVNAALRTARRMFTDQQISLLILDYIQLLSNGVDNRAVDIGMTTAALRGFALDYRIPVLAAAQLSREIEKRAADEEPKLSDLRESGAIEQDSSICIFPRPVRNPSVEQLMQFPENRAAIVNGTIIRPKAVPAIFHVLKNRNGQTGPTELIKWVKSTDKYYTLQAPRL